MPELSERAGIAGFGGYGLEEKPQRRGEAMRGDPDKKLSV